VCRSQGNNGNNLDLMLSVRHEPKRNEITGHALITIQKFIESLDYKPLDPNNLKFGVNSKKHVEPVTVLVSDLINIYKWQPCLCNMATFLPIFVEVIDNDRVLLEDVPKFDKLMYKVMGE